MARKSHSTGLYVVPRQVPNLWRNLTGKKRTTTVFVTWGGDKKNKQKVKKAVNMELDLLGLEKGSKERSHKAVGVR